MNFLVLYHIRTGMQERKAHILIFFSLLLIASCSASVSKSSENSSHENEFEGMILVQGGEATFGNYQGFTGEQPEFSMRVNAFYLDEHEVTVSKFRKFIEETGFKTEAEKFGDAGVFDLDKKVWYLHKNATWHHPLGPDGPAALDDHPVTQVSWNDAVAYCRWVGKRLPTEFEFEYASRKASTQPQLYNWGDALVENDKYMANTWQGKFPDINLQKDGYLYTSAVGTFGKNALGFEDLGGNVWEWTASWYQPYDNVIAGINDSSANLRTIKGGSFMCDTSFCCGYRISARNGTSPETSLFHIGFRCAVDVK
ncbi:MAG: formylglycine-generating enzyme family protein [Chitinophagales bacterium]